MFRDIHKAAIGSFILPLISALFAIFMPIVHTTFNYIIIAIFVMNIVSYIIFLSIFKKKKRQNAARLVILLNMLAFCLFFTFPFIKAFSDQPWVQFILIVIFFLTIVLAIYDQNKDVPLVFPTKGKERRKFAFVYYSIPVLVVVLGGGGNLIVVRELESIFGNGYVTYLGGISLYILGCWFVFFFQSLCYQGFVKNGLWVK